MNAVSKGNIQTASKEVTKRRLVRRSVNDLRTLRDNLQQLIRVVSDELLRLLRERLLLRDLVDMRQVAVHQLLVTSALASDFQHRACPRTSAGCLRNKREAPVNISDRCAIQSIQDNNLKQDDRLQGRGRTLHHTNPVENQEHDCKCWVRDHKHSDYDCDSTESGCEPSLDARDSELHTGITPLSKREPCRGIFHCEEYGDEQTSNNDTQEKIKLPRTFYQNKAGGLTCAIGEAPGPKLQQNITNKGENRQMIKHTQTTVNNIGCLVPHRSSKTVNNKAQPVNKNPNTKAISDSSANNETTRFCSKYSTPLYSSQTNFSCISRKCSYSCHKTTRPRSVELSGPSVYDKCALLTPLDNTICSPNDAIKHTPTAHKRLSLRDFPCMVDDSSFLQTRM